MQKIKNFCWSALIKAYKIYKLNSINEINENEKQTILVLGSARSGTTWVGDVIAGMMKARIIFEPFLLDQNKQFFFINKYKVNEENLTAALKASYQLYLKPSVSHNDYHEQIKTILSGKFRSLWTDVECKAGIYNRRIIKDVRANLFLGYIATHWPEIKIVWVIRNPFDVIESQILMRETQRWHFEWDAQNILDQQDIVDNMLGPYVPSMLSASTIYEKLAHRWCIETFVPFKQNVVALPNVLKVSYDDLTSNKEAWNNICYFLTGNEYSRKWDSLLCKQSHTSRPKALRNKMKIDTNNLKAIRKIIKGYGLEAFINEKQ